ncbi:hypothetical protein [Rathayibacter toxicus]|uniref:Uncharacterized protein n=1 Tax=Rathayibacter toxicus TaxID=145458 RepID=A0A2S5Y9U3_9MICO|nr:hypothetical protein [Rathayibacter toxicus]PPH25496.1 hypothetical protein C5D17_00255 [Rathayibacter toxicus]PPH59198.1 hypothetical protein C5D30_00255 [Rathayibacter toxicus]PPH61308.1 hypothetical protein C5C93_00255 [Rathayibacter toxicus]PPH89274.1 hypothetical protein C5D31_00260 [Rathayibacter toxicus]PPI17100.1 hypothetical protein C5C51_00255 [Rathayibacter toxicus]
MASSVKKRIQPAQQHRLAQRLPSVDGSDELGRGSYRPFRERIAQARPRRRRWDLALSVLGCLALGALCIGCGFFSLILAIFPAQCEGQNFSCDFDRIDWGVSLALIGPPLVTLIAVGVTVVRYLVGRRAFWIPIVGLGLCVADAILASWLVTSAIPGAALF